jgi:hypothetical protein
VLLDELQPPVGLERCGVVTLARHRTSAVEPVRIEPPGLAQQVLGHDLPDPYGGA